MNEMDQMIERLNKKYSVIELLSMDEYYQVMWILFKCDYTIDDVVDDNNIYNRHVVDKYYEVNNRPSNDMVINYLHRLGELEGADYEFFNSINIQRTYDQEKDDYLSL